MVSPSEADASRTHPSYLVHTHHDEALLLPRAGEQQQQHAYMSQYYANMHNFSPYSTTTTTTPTSETPSLYDRYRESGMINCMEPILLSLICPEYQDLPSKSNPLFAIRLASKRGAEVAAPFLFRTLSLLDLQATRMRRLVEQAPHLGPHVRRLIIQPRLDEHAVPDIDKLDPCIVNFLCFLPNVEELVVWSISRDTYPHPVLLTAFGTLLPRLRSVELQEEGLQCGVPYPEKPQDAVAHTWQNHLNTTLLLYRASTLTHLTIASRQSLHTTVFLLLRDAAPALHSLSLTSCIGLSLQPLFAQPVRWACAPALRALAFHQCRGVHASTLVRHVAAGRFGQLDALTVHGCGDASGVPNVDDDILPTTSSSGSGIGVLRWAPPAPLRVLALALAPAGPRDARAYALLHTGALVLPRAAAAADAFLGLLLEPHAFPGLRAVHAPAALADVFPPHVWRGVPFLLQKRGIVLVQQDGPVRASCACPMD